jgi:hypothetical protein
MQLRISCLWIWGLMAFALQSVVVAQTGGPAPSLTGSWQFTEQSNSAAVAVVVSGLATFTADGSAVETDTGEAAAHATPGHGIWQPAPVFGSLYIQFISLSANPNGSLHSKRIVKMFVTPNAAGDQFSGEYSFEVVDPTGRVMTTGSGTVTGQLIPHPLLP